MKRALLFGLMFLLQVLPAGGQNTHKSAVLSGAVIKEPGDQPLKKVLLHLVAEDQREGGNYTTETDAEGRFRFEDVQPGRYRLLLEKTGFHSINVRGYQTDGPILTVQRGQEINDLLFQMLQAAVITGRVVDEDGVPMANYGVSLLKRKPGKAGQTELAGEERSNDLGEYRFSGLFPGRYYVAVVPPPDIRNFAHMKETPGSSRGTDMTYLPTYYPGTNDGSQASPIDLRAGDELPVNFTMIPAQSYRIRGIVTGIPANQKPIVQLVSRGVIQTMNGADVAADGQFEIRGVSPGSYFATVFTGAEGQIMTARQMVTVVSADVEGVKLVPVRPFTVSGHVRFENFWPKDVTQDSAYLRPADSDDSASTPGPGGTASAQLDQTGNFQWTDVTPGNYVAEFSGNGDRNMFLKAVILGHTSYNTGFELTGPASVELLISAHAATLEGVVSEGDKAAAGALVVAVPDDKYRDLRARFGTGSTDQYGHFLIHGLAPGSYTVFAWQDLEDDLYYDAAFLKSQESNGTSLKVEEGSRQKVELKVSPVGADWQ